MRLASVHFPNDRRDDWPGVKEKFAPRSGWRHGSGRRRNRPCGRGQQPRESSQSSFRPHPMSSPAASWRRDATMPPRKARAWFARRSVRQLCDASAVIDLQDPKTSRGTHCSGERLQAGQMSVMCRAYALPGAPVLCDAFAAGWNWWRRIRSPHSTPDGSSSCSVTVPSSWEESSRSSAARSQTGFAISRPQTSLKGDHTTIVRNLGCCSV